MTWDCKIIYETDVFQQTPERQKNRGYSWFLADKLSCTNKNRVAPVHPIEKLTIPCGTNPRGDSVYSLIQLNLFACVCVCVCECVWLCVREIESVSDGLFDGCDGGLDYERQIWESVWRTSGSLMQCPEIERSRVCVYLNPASITCALLCVCVCVCVCGCVS